MRWLHNALTTRRCCRISAFTRFAGVIRWRRRRSPGQYKLCDSAWDHTWHCWRVRLRKDDGSDGSLSCAAQRRNDPSGWRGIRCPRHRRLATRPPACADHFPGSYSSLNPRLRAAEIVREPMIYAGRTDRAEQDRIIDQLFQAVGLRQSRNRCSHINSPEVSGSASALPVHCRRGRLRLSVMNPCPPCVAVQAQILIC